MEPRLAPRRLVVLKTDESELRVAEEEKQETTAENIVENRAVDECDEYAASGARSRGIGA
jgi:hypothetical protein